MANKINLSGFKLKLNAFFIREAKILIKAGKNLMSRKQGYNLDSAPPNAPSTVRKKGFSHWMKNTGETIKNAFQFAIRRNKLDNERLIIYASGQRHSGRQEYVKKSGQGSSTRNNSPTYRSLFRWHNAEKYSGVMGLPKGAKTADRLKKEVDSQLKTFIHKQTPKKIKIKIKMKK